MLLTKMVEVDDACVAALTPEAFRLVLEARGWERYTINRIDGVESRAAWWPQDVSAVDEPPEFFDGDDVAAIHAMADAHHAGSTYAAFVEAERVQALLEAVEAAERGEWRRDAVWAARGAAEAQVTTCGWVTLRLLHAADEVSRLWPTTRMLPDPDPARAAREARAQLPRLVRIICGVEP